MTTDAVHRRLCHSLFDALERGDVDAVASCYAPDMTMWADMEVCFVGYVRDGMISRAYEYFDTGQIEKFIGPRPAKEASIE